MSGNTTLNTTGAGTVTVTATVANGIVLANNTLGDYTKDFTITVKAQGPLDISVGFNLNDIAVTGNDGTNAIYKGGTPSSLTLGVVAEAGYTDVKWYVDAGPAIATNPITINAADYTMQPHTITFTGKKGEGYYSQSIPFIVGEADGTVNIIIDGANPFITGSDGTNDIYKNGTPSSFTLTATGYTEPVWYVDGAGTGIPGSSIVIEAANYTAQPHYVTFKGIKDGVPYSSNHIPFMVHDTP
jgi:hypothetical protein